jgi:hypothetical protein
MNLAEAEIVLIQKSAIVLLSVGVMTLGATAVNAVSAPAPKVGQCFNYTNSEISMENVPKKAAVSCSLTHNIEVYRVAKYTYKKSPYDISESDLWSLANKACQPWKGNVAKTKFNYWAFYTPTKSQWAKGERWIRCDAAIVTTNSSGDITAYTKWKGKKLDVK